MKTILETCQNLAANYQMTEIIFLRNRLLENNENQSFSEIIIEPVKKVFILSDESFSIKFTDEQFNSIKELYGLDIEVYINQAILNEIEITDEQKIFDKYNRLAKRNEFPLSWKQKMLKRYFSISFPKYIQKIEDFEKFILKESNILQKENRSGKPFCICGRILASYFLDSKNFTFSASNIISSYQMTSYGNLINIPIFISQDLENYDIILGLTTQENMKGVYNVFTKSNRTDCKSIDTNKIVFSRYSLVDEVGDNVEKMFKKFTIEMKKKPLWRKILGV